MDTPRRIDPEAGLAQAARELRELFPAVYALLHRRRPRGAVRADGAMLAAMRHLAHIGPLTVGEAARHLERAQSVISELVDRLVRRGLAERMPDARDRRRALIWLTPEGIAALEEEHEVLSRERVQAALSRMSLRSRRELVAGLRALVRAAEEVRRDAVNAKCELSGNARKEEP
jgi:DNA-binding MarR family transcriptional regulator